MGATTPTLLSKHYLSITPKSFDTHSTSLNTTKNEDKCTDRRAYTIYNYSYTHMNTFILYVLVVYVVHVRIILISSLFSSLWVHDIRIKNLTQIWD